MQPDTLDSDWRSYAIVDRLPRAWQLPLARLALAWLAVLVLTLRDWVVMVDQWWNISTYNHILFVPFIVGWFVWLRRHELAKLAPSAWTPGLALLAGSLFLWLVGTIAGINTISQLGAVLSFQACVASLLGPRVVAALLFPLAYALFLVPFGDELVPALQMITADMAIALTHWSGVPAEVDGVFINTPAGLFEVAEACSGVKFLIAMVALGVLVMHSCFASWKRRLVFLAAAISLPILANGVRAWGTIYIAQSQGIEFAAGFDHIFYGWVFFGIVIAMLLAGAWRWFDRDPEDPQISASAILSNAFIDRISSNSGNANFTLALTIALAGVFGAWSAASSKIEAGLPEAPAYPIVSGWDRVDLSSEVAWEPRATGADRRQTLTYRDAQGGTVDIVIAVYAAQDHDKDPTAADEGALPPETAWRWLEPGASTHAVRSDFLLANGHVRRLAQTTYRSGDVTTASAARLKLSSLANRLLLRPQATTMLIVSAEGQDADELTDRLDRFADSIGDRGEWMDRAAGLR